jgi:hypothetical protein
MADDAPFPLYGSTFSDQGEQPPADIPFPLYGSTFGKETIRDPVAAGAGVGLSGVPTQRGTWEDVAHYGAAGLHDIGATGAGFMASVSGDRDSEAGWRQAALEQQQAAQESREAVTPTVEAGWRHPIMWAAEQGPGFAALAIPAAVATAATAPIGGIGGPALLGGVMGAQARGDVYNRLTGEGITPTGSQLATATEVGMAQGVATDLTGGLVSKLPVSKLVGQALGVTGDVGAFGAGAAGQEYTTQQAEIAAGQRDRVDTGAVGGAFVGGAEMGAGFGVPHLLGSGRHRDLTQTPGEASVAREDPQAQRDQTKHGTGVGTPEQPTDANRQPPTSPLDDPTLAAGAKGETVTPGSNEQAEPVIQQSEVAQPGPGAAGTAPEGAQAAPTTGPPSPPPPSPKAQPAPGPAPADEAVAPEPQATLQAQHADLLDKSNPRQLVVYNPGEEPLPLPKNQGFATTPLPDGRTAQYWRYGDDKLTAAKLASSTPDDLNRLLQSSTVNKNQAVDLAVAGVGEPAVVTTRKPSPDGVTPGTEVKAGATTTAVAPDDVALHKATAAPGDTVQVEHPATTIGDRFAKVRDEIAARKAEMDAAERGEFTPESKPEPVAAAPVAPVDPLAGATKLAENKFGVSVHQMPDGTYRKVKDGVVSTISEDTAKILTGEKTYAAETSAAEAIRQQAEKTAPKGRVFRSETAEEQAAAARQSEADRIAAERVASEKPTAKPIKEKEEMKERNLSAEKRDELLRINRIGDEAVDAHPIGPKDGLAIDPNQPGGQGARTELLNRVRAMVKDATDKGYKLMKPLRERIGETNHTNKNILLHEADLLGRKKVAKTSDIRRYLNSEHELLHNGEEGRANVMKMRSETGKELAAERGKGVKERATEDVEQAAAPTVREGVKEGAAIEKPDVGDEYAAAKERVAEEEVAKEPGAQREMTEQQRAAIEAGKRAAARVAEEERVKAAGGRERPTVTPKSEEGTEGEEPAVKGYADRTAAFKVEKRRPTIKRQEIEEGPTGKVMTSDADGNPIEVTSRRTITARQAIVELGGVKSNTVVGRRITERLLPALLKLAGDTKVHFISHEDMLSTGERAHGVYDPVNDHILINDDHPLPGTLLHELFHAATAKALEASPDLRRLMERLHGELQNNLTSLGEVDRSRLQGVANALKDPEEMLTELMTNENVQNFFKNIKISDQLAKDIGIPKWRNWTMWNGVLHVIQRALGLEPRDVSAIEGAMAITEKTMISRDPGMAMEAAARSTQHQIQEMRPRFQRMAPEQQVESNAKNAQEATRKPWEFWKSELAKATKSGAQEAGYKAFTLASNFDTLRIASEHLFGRRDDNNSFRRVQEGTAKMDQAIRTMLGEHDPLVQRMADMKKANPDGLDRIVTLLSESADYGVHPDDALGQGRNSYINPRSKQFDETAGREHHEAILAHPRLSDEYNRSTPEEQKLFRDLRDELMVEGKKNAQAHYDSFSSALRYNFEKDGALQEALGKSESARSPAELKKVERYNAVTKVLNGDKLNGDKLDGDEKEQFYNDPQISALRELKNLQKQEEPYMPSTRKGEWVVNGEHDIPKADNAISQKDNEAVFSTLKDAYDYRKTLVDNSLPSTLETIKEPTSSEQGRGSGADTYRVTVQNKHSSAVETKYEGDKLAETLRAQGVKNVTNPMLREKNEHIDYGLHSGTVRAIGHAIDALTHLSKEERQVQHDALEQASLGLMRGNRINQGLMRRNRVKGANADPVLAVHDYFAASARNRAQARFMPDMNRALDEMRDHARTTQDEDTWKRGLLIRQAEERALNFGKDGFTGQMPNVLQNLSTLAFVKYMMAPIHYALDLTHPYLISIPQIAGRHGMAKTQLEFQRTLGDMGGRFPTLLKGGKGMWEAALKSGHMPTDFAGMIRARLEKNKATPDELRAFDQAIETGALHSILMDFRPHFEKTGNVNRALQRAQSVGQEMSSAVDAINRIATYMTAYKLERSRMIGPQQPGSFAHHAQAIRYAKDVVTQTQGLYTPSNRAAMLRNPMVRAAMQFRSVPMMIYKVMARNIYDMVKPESPEVRWAAVRAFVGTMGTTALLAGATGGVPEPIRLAIMLTHALGLTGSWEDLEDAARREADAALGKMGGRVVMDGVLGAAGLSAGNRLGLSDLFIKGEPQSAKDFIFQLMGAQAGYATDEIKGINQILHGDLQHGLPAGIPIRFFSDVAKAYYDNQEGKPGRGATPSMQPLDPYETFIRAMGGTPTREANYYKMTGLIQEAKTNKQAAVQAGIGGNMAAVTQWNATHPHDRISPSHVLKAKQNRQGDTSEQRRTAEEYSAYQ